MLTLDAILRTSKQNSAYGLTGKHVFGKGHERVDGTFSDGNKAAPAEAAQPPIQTMEPK